MFSRHSREQKALTGRMIIAKQALREGMCYACNAIYAHKAYVNTERMHRITMYCCTEGAAAAYNTARAG